MEDAVIENKERRARLRIDEARLALYFTTAGAASLRTLTALGAFHAKTKGQFFSNTIRSAIPSLKHAELPEELSETLAELTVEEGERASNAAQLIFVHSGCESALETLCDAIAGYKPELWFPILQERRVTLADAAGEWHRNLSRVLSNYLEELRKESIVLKTRRLFSILQPATGHAESFSFSETRLEEVDQRRHQCAHGNYRKLSFENLDEDTAFLINTAEYFIDEAERKFAFATTEEQKKRRSLQRDLFEKNS